jgi:hypothetical protein
LRQIGPLIGGHNDTDRLTDLAGKGAGEFDVAGAGIRKF